MVERLRCAKALSHAKRPQDAEKGKMVAQLIVKLKESHRATRGKRTTGKDQQRVGMRSRAAHVPDLLFRPIKRKSVAMRFRHHHALHLSSGHRLDTAAPYVLTMLGVKNMSSSCLETDSDLFLNNQPRTGMRDIYGTPWTLLF
jgi:hypothetical protein